jgi:hypothetical protein
MGLGLLIGGVVAGLVVVGAIALYASRPRLDADDIVDDANTCAACGNTDLTHPAEGVYVCRCGFQGGPGLPDHIWRLEDERIAAMPEDERERLRAASEQDARLQLISARGSFEAAARAFAEGEAIVPMGSRGAAQKTAAYDQVRGHLPEAERALQDAIGAVERTRQIARGGGRMSAYYDRLGGSRETALTLTGMQATAALRAQLSEVRGVLEELERELAG